MKGWFRRSLLCGVWLAGCDPDWSWPGGDDDDDTQTELPGEINVVNCSSNPIVVSWKLGSVLNDPEDSIGLPLAHGPADPPSCGQSVHIEFLDFLDYWVTVTKDINNCAAQDICTDNTTQHYLTDPEGYLETWEVK